VVFLVLVVVSFVRGLDASLVVSGHPRVVLVHTLGSSENIENSTMPGNAAGLLSASLSSIPSREGQAFVSPELYLGSEVRLNAADKPRMGLLRGVTPAVSLVRTSFQLTEGAWPKAGEVLAGELAATKLGSHSAALAVGKRVWFEGRSWTVSGRFRAGGSSLESELWCPLEDLQIATQRQDLSLVAVMLDSPRSIPDVEEFCKERLDLEWEATPEQAYYASLQKHYGPVRMVAWVMVVLIGGAGGFAGLNTMYGAVVGRVRELAMLQTLGFLRRAIALSLVQEALLLSVAGALIAALAGLAFLNGLAVRFTMGAFPLRVDSVSIAVALITGVVIGVLGAIPPAVRAMRMPVVEALKAT
jgi:ABC-type lipoprotein release transport system permease subunit